LHHEQQKACHVIQTIPFPEILVAVEYQSTNFVGKEKPQYCLGGEDTGALLADYGVLGGAATSGER